MTGPVKAIVKVQTPLYSTDPEASDQLMIYPQTRERICFQRPTEAVLAALNGDPKGYFEATYERGRWTIGKRVEDRPW